MVVFAISLAGVADAQVRGVEPGSRVRITTENRVTTGTLERWTGDSLVFRPRGTEATALPASAVERFEVSRERHSRVGRGALIGFGAGAGFGLLTGLLACSEESCGTDSDEVTGLVTGVLVVTGAATGAALGAVIGAFLHTERWQIVPVGGADGARGAAIRIFR